MPGKSESQGIDPTYDPATQTVADDDGERVSIFDVDDCPRCGDVGMTHVPAGAWYDDRNDHVFCFAIGCDFHGERPAAGLAVTG